MIWELYFLGTSSNIPYDRNHPSVFLRYFGKGILFDAGECVQRQMYKLKLHPSNIDIILLTHWHGDHSLGLGGIFQSIDVNKEIILFGPKRTKEKIKKLFEVYEFYSDFKLKVYDVSLKPGEEKIIYEDKDFYIKAIGVIHSIDTLSYIFIEKDKRKAKIDKLKELGLYNNPLVGKLIEGKPIEYKGKKIYPEDVTYIKKGIKIGYLVDTMFFEDLINKFKGVDYLIIECMFISKELAREKKHLSLEDVCKIIKYVKYPFIIHISQRHSKDIPKILNELKKCNKNTKIPNDLDYIK